MQFRWSRLWVGTVVLTVGMIGLSQLHAAEVADDAFKSILENDVKRVNELVKKYNDTPDKKAPIQIRSTAMMIAAYAQSKITGGADDKKWSGLRDQAVEVYKSALNKKLNIKAAPTLDPAKSPPGKGDKVDLVKVVPFDINDLMAQFKKTTVLGLNMEDDIKSASKKGTKVDAAGIAARVQFAADFVAVLEPDGGFEGAEMTKKAWDNWNEKMRAAAKDVSAAGSDAKKLKEAFTRLDGACAGCHNIFK